MMTALVIAGAALFAVMGLAHIVVTMMSGVDGGPLAPTDPDVRRAMHASTGLGMAPQLDTTLWRAWVGFNLSHGLGVVAIAAVILYHAIDDLDAAAGEPWFLALALGAPPLYLVLSVRYWFDRPTRGIVVGGLLVIVGTLGAALG